MAVKVIARAWPALPAVAIVTVVLLRLGFDQGGYFPAAFTSAGAIAFITLAVLAARPLPRPSTPAVVAVATLGAFACWMGLSRAWSVVPDVPVHDMQRAMLYVALLALGLLASTGARPRARLLVWCVLGIAVVLVGAGLLSRLQPDLLHPAVDPISAASYRLGHPFGYWNALGAMASLGAVLALGLAADAQAAALLRAAAAGASVLLVVAMYLSLSRGAWLTLIIGVVVLLAIAPNRISLLLTLLVAGGAATLAILRLRGYPGLVIDPQAGSGQEAQGDAFLRELAALVVVAGAAQAAQGALAAGRATTAVRERISKIRRSALIVAAVVGVLLLAGAVSLATQTSPTRAVSSAGDWIDRQWQDFMDPVSTPGVSTDRLLSAKGSRSDAYRVALDGFAAHPLVGGGAGSFEVRYARDRRIDLKLRDAHSLPLETLSELGAVGMLLLLGFVAAVATAARLALVGRATIRPAEAAAVSTAFVVWFTHAGLDWNWQMPALTGTAMVMCATLFAPSRRTALAIGAGDGLPSSARDRGHRRTPRDRSPISRSVGRFRRPRRSVGARAWPKLVTMIVVGVALGAAVGVGLGRLGGDDPAPAPATSALQDVDVRVLDARLHPAETASGAERGRARMTVRIRAENRGTTPVSFARPALLVERRMIRTDRNADSRDTHLPSLQAGERAAVTLRFEVSGAVTSALRTRRRARLAFGELVLRLVIKVVVPARETSEAGASQSTPSQTSTTPPQATQTGTTAGEPAQTATTAP